MGEGDEGEAGNVKTNGGNSSTYKRGRKRSLVRPTGTREREQNEKEA